MTKCKHRAAEDWSFEYVDEDDKYAFFVIICQICGSSFKKVEVVKGKIPHHDPA